MQFDDTYNVHCNLTLLSGRVITLDQLVQGRTYAGLMEGTPAKGNNDQLIERHLEKAKSLQASHGTPFLIQPLRKDYQLTRGDMQPYLDRQIKKFGEVVRIPEWLPEVYTIAVFRSMTPARDSESDFSVLSVLWYQAEFGIDEVAFEAVRALDWDSVATDTCW